MEKKTNKCRIAFCRETPIISLPDWSRLCERHYAEYCDRQDAEYVKRLEVEKNE